MMWHWIVENILLNALHSAVFTLTTGIVTTLILVPFRNELKKIWRSVDSLDPQTDTGVTGQLHKLLRDVDSPAKFPNGRGK